MRKGETLDPIQVRERTCGPGGGHASQSAHYQCAGCADLSAASVWAVAADPSAGLEAADPRPSLAQLHMGEPMRPQASGPGIGIERA